MKIFLFALSFFVVAGLIFVCTNKLLALSGDLVLYDNSVNTSFADGTFGYVSRNPCSKVTYTSAPCSYAISYKGWGGINFQVIGQALDTSSYKSIDWNIHPSGYPLSFFSVLLTDKNGHWVNEVILSHKNIVEKLPNGWVHVSVPIKQLNKKNKLIGTIQLKNAKNRRLNTIYVDDVRLVAADVPTPIPTATPTPTPTPTSTATPTPIASQSASLLPGQQLWKNNVSSYLFGTNDSEDYDPDNFDTDPHNIIQSSLKNAGFQLMRMFIFHYSLIDGHRVTLGTNPQIQLNPLNSHEFDTPAAQYTTVTPNQPYGYELETRLSAIENSGMQCLIVLPDIRTDSADNTDPNPMHKRIIDPDTGSYETDLDFARKVVAYAGNRCNLYEIGNEPDLDQFIWYNNQTVTIPHLSVGQYLQKWAEFTSALRQINPHAKFIGPVSYNGQGNDCYYGNGTPPVPGSQNGYCYMQNFLLGAKNLGALPDAVSFHWYPCDSATDGFDGSGNCGPAQSASYATVTKEVKGWVHDILQKDVPVGITEWNFDPGSNALGENATFMSQFSTQSLQAMISAGLDFANQFDAQSYGGYGHLDMFDILNNDQPKAQFTSISSIISQYK